MEGHGICESAFSLHWSSFSFFLARTLQNDKKRSYSGLGLLRGSWDLVTRVIIQVTILITTYNPS